MRSIAVALVSGLLIGVVIGAALATWFVSSSPSPLASTSVERPQPEQDISPELALLRQENAMLVAMVKAGLRGDISGHIQAFSQIAKQNANPAVDEANTHTKLDTDFIADNPLPSAPQLVNRLQRADKKLQQQALAEGWATSDRLTQERQLLWQQARRQLNDNDLMDALFQAEQPNVLMVDGVRPGSQASIQGVKHGDLLWRLDGIRIFTRSEYNAHIAQLTDDVLVNVEFKRDNVVTNVVMADLKRNLSVVGDSIARANSRN